MKPQTALRMKIVTVLLAGLATGLAGLLMYQSQTLEALPGCGGGSGCETVLSSRWSLWLGIPVSLMAMMLYTAMLVAVVLRDPGVKRPQRAAAVVMVLSAFATIAAAIWFIGVQVFAVGALCKYCLATHTAGVAASVLCLIVALPSLPKKPLTSVSVGALLLTAILIAGQVLGDPPASAAPRVQFATDTPSDHDTKPTAAPNKQDPLFADAYKKHGPAPPKPTPAAGSTNTANGPYRPTSVKPHPIKLYGGRLGLDPAEVPRIGNPDARDVLVVLFDYTCSHCRDTKKMLAKTAQKHGDSLVIFFLPAPLDSKCNRLVKRINPMHRYACDLAKISLAFWKVAPDKWEQFDRMLYTNEQILTPVRAKFVAGKLIDKKDLDRALKDPWVDQQLQRDVSLYAAAYKAAKNPTLPMLITRNGVMNGTPQHPLEVDDLIKGKRR